MKKPELLVTPKSVNEISQLLEAGADAITIGEQRYALRMAGEFSKENIREAVSLTHQCGKKVYVAMNAIFHNEKVDELADYLRFLNDVQVDAVIFGDPAVLMTAREVAPDLSLHWNTEMTATNWFTCNYWGNKGAKRAVLARELSLDEVLETKENATVEIEVQIHGMTCMFQSKRHLIGNYFSYQNRNMKVEQLQNKNGLYLHDQERDTKYPVFEDENGTHIMSPNDMCMIDELADLIDGNIDSLKIDGILKSADYLIEVTKLYRKAIDLCVNDRDQYDEIKDGLLEEVKKIQPSIRPIDTGFFFKETVY